MKVKILLTGILLSFIFTSNAQNDFPKGSVLLGGNINYSSNNTEDPFGQKVKNRLFGISPAAGIAVKKNLFVGINAGFMFGKNWASTPNPGIIDSSRYHAYSYGLFVRKYVPLKYNFSIFLQGDLGGSNSDQHTKTNNPADYYYKAFQAGAGLTPGFSYSINSRLQLETGLNSIIGVQYTSGKTNNSINNPGPIKSNSFSAYTSLSNFSSQLFIGFRLLLQKKDRSINSSKAG